MNAQDIMAREDFKKCAEFHGHICPGLSIGYRAAKAGMEWLAENRAGDEEIVAIVETDACSADAVQVLTGCTFGKGNFIYKDHGKMILTLLSRNSGQGVRVAIKGDAFQPDAEHMALIQKKIQGTLDDAGQKRFQELHARRSGNILEMPLEKLFRVEPVEMTLPPRAKIEPSKPCDLCGEPTMATKLETVDGKKICRGCLEIRA